LLRKFNLQFTHNQKVEILLNWSLGNDGK
jgi:hypothetical protein